MKIIETLLEGKIFDSHYPIVAFILIKYTRHASVKSPGVYEASIISAALPFTAFYTISTAVHI